MKEAVENKKAELKQSCKEIPAKNIDILRLIDTSYLYGLINDGISKYNDFNTTHLIIQILLLLSIMITKRPQVTKRRKPYLSLYMKTTMVL